jgi:uncharacterized membrane protein
MVAPKNFDGVAFWIIVVGLASFWVLAYAFAIQRARVDKRVGIPSLAVAGNFAWELVHSLVIQQQASQRPFNFVWLLVDTIILSQVFRYGNKDFPSLYVRAFRRVILGTLAWAAVFMILMTRELHDVLGLYDGTILVVFVSASFIYTLQKRRSSAGQSMYIATCKWVGTFLAGLNTVFVYPHRWFVLFMFGTAFVLDVTYMVMLHRQIRAEGASPWAFNRPRVVAPDEVAANDALSQGSQDVTTPAGRRRSGTASK